MDTYIYIFHENIAFISTLKHGLHDATPYAFIATAVCGKDEHSMFADTHGKVFLLSWIKIKKKFGSASMNFFLLRSNTEFEHFRTQFYGGIKTPTHIHSKYSHSSIAAISRNIFQFYFVHNAYITDVNWTRNRHTTIRRIQALCSISEHGFLRWSTRFAIFYFCYWSRRRSFCISPSLSLTLCSHT